jgi:hypothetical protein
MNPSDLVLLLTASVDPLGMPGVTRADPKEREFDYYDSLRYYIEEHPAVKKIVFIENSGWPLEEIQKASRDNPHGKDIEFISMRCNDFPRERGKSYGEMLLMEKGIEQSRLAKTARFLAKITGRLRLANLTRLVEKMPDDVSLLCDLRDHPIYDILGMKACGHHADTRLIVFSPAYYEAHIKGQYVHMNEAKGVGINTLFIERFFYDLVKAGGSGVYPRLSLEPEFHGFAGHRGKHYDSKKEIFKKRARNLARKIVPWLHI